MGKAKSDDPLAHKSRGPPRSYVIGSHAFEAGCGTVRDEAGAEKRLRPKSAEVLRHLAERGGQLVSRSELIDAVWPGLFVTDDSLTQCIIEIRQALGPDHELLRTLSRRGYMLGITPLQAAPEPRAAAEEADLDGRSGVPVVAVLPFSMLAPDQNLAGFAGILLDSLVGALAALREPVVISANSTRHILGRNEDVSCLAGRFSVNYIVSGTLHRMGQHIRLSIEVAEAARGIVVCHRAFDLTEAVLFQMPDELVAVVAHTLAPRIREAELRKARRRQHDLSAYHLVLEAQTLMFRLEPHSFTLAGEMLRRASALDPGFAAPHAMLGDWYSLRIGQGWSSDVVVDACALESEVRMATELDARHASALALLGHNHTILYRQYDRAMELFGRALEAAPNGAEAHLWSSPTLAYIGEAKEAVRSAERAISLSPEDPLLFRYQHFLSIAHYADGALEEAAHWGLRSMRSNRDYLSNLRLTAAALAALGRTEEARPLAARILQLQPDYRASVGAARTPFRDEALRERYGKHLVMAGLPS